MGLSDVLSDTIHEIKDYQKQAAYEDLTKEIDVVINAMDAVREHLNQPFDDNERPSTRPRMRERLGLNRAAINSRIEAKIQAMETYAHGHLSDPSKLNEKDLYEFVTTWAQTFREDFT